MDKSDPFNSFDQLDVRVEEARLLKSGAMRSAQMVSYVIFAAGLLLLITNHWTDAIFWIVVTLSMVLVTLLYAKFKAPEGIARNNVTDYLRWHLIITFITGSIWGAFAIYFTDPEAHWQVHIASFFLISITLGGMMKGAVYRAGYLALLVPSLLPFGLYLLVFGSLYAKVVGFGFFVYAAFGFFMSKPMDSVIHDGLVAQINKEAAQKIIDQQHEIERLNEDKIRLMASITHDMTQPLIAQRQYIDTLNAEITDEKHRGVVSKLEIVQNSQERLLEQLVEHSRFEKTEIVVAKKAFDLGPILDKLVSEFNGSAREKNIEIISENHDLTAYSDPLLVERIIRNFLSNAIKYTPKGGRVKLSCILQNENVEIMVSDNGSGISENDQKRIFDEYVRLDQNKHISGLGLGLSIVHRLSELIGGQVHINSELGKGTDICLLIPHQSQEKDAGHVDADITVQPPLILVIGTDDREEFGGWENLTSSWLWQCFKSDTIDDAVSIVSIANLNPDIVVLDNVFDEQNELAADLQKLENGPLASVPIILVDDENNPLATKFESETIRTISSSFQASDLRKLAQEMI
jgi:signal transduction histidine kinase